jgi:hypothetical protein
VYLFSSSWSRMSVHDGRSRRQLHSVGATFNHLNRQKTLPPTTSTFERTSLLSLIGIVIGMLTVVIGISSNTHWIIYTGFGEMSLIIIWFIYLFIYQS